MRAIEIRLQANEPVLACSELLRDETARAAIVVTELNLPIAYAEGVHTISWNGTDGSRAEVADDTYWLRILAFFRSITTTVTRWLCRFWAVPFVLAAFMPVSYSAWAVASPRCGLSLLERNTKQHLLLAQNLPWCTSPGPAIHGRAFTRIADAWGHQQGMRVHPATVTDALGRTTTYSYDANGNKSGESITGGITRSWTYVPPAEFGVPIKSRPQ